MIITLISAGTRGDIQPFIALGQALKTHGARVRVAAMENFVDFVQGYGLEAFPIAGDVTQAMDSTAAQEALQADNPLKFFSSFGKLQTMAQKLQKGFYAACEGTDAVVYHPGVALGYFIAQQMGVPGILAAPFPMTPTRAYPAILFYNGPRFGPTYNRLTHQLFQQGMWMALKNGVKGFWQSRFGRVPRPFSNPFPKQTTASAPTVVSCSQYVFPRPVDWPEHVHMDGYWTVQEAHDYQPPAALRDFLKGGKPPVYVGFGSMADKTRAMETTRMVVEAIQRAGQRGVLATGWKGLSDELDLPEEIFVLESAPHTWLFPRMAVVVHHGGAGTTAAGLQAGTPCVVTPFALDQFAWARRVWELGVGAKPIPRKELTVSRLTAGIQEALRPSVCESAKALGEKIRSERGADRAAEVILETLYRRK